MNDPGQPPDIDPIAALDQALRSLTDVARILHTFYTALVAEGFTEEQALEMTIAYQLELHRSANE